MAEWQYFPRTRPIPNHLTEVVAAFESIAGEIASGTWGLSSNQVLAKVAVGLTALGFSVESGKTRDAKVTVPVLFGRNGRILKAFEVDAYSEGNHTVIEVEAGRALTNNQFLKDLFEACVMPSVDYLVLVVRSEYRKSKDFDRICTFLEPLFASDRLALPLHGILVIGY